MNRIAVLIPCFNEATTIKKVVEDFHREIPDATIYVYNNNSTDGSDNIAFEAGAVVRNEPLQGKGNVVRRMFREIDADCYIMVDGDDTYSPESAKDMVKSVIEGGYDMVIGDRLSTSYFSENKRPFHNFGNKLVSRLINELYNSHVTDIMTGYRAFSKRFVKLFPVMSSNFEIETEMTIHALDKRFSIKGIPTPYKDRPEGSISKLNTLSDGRKVLRIIFTLFKEYHPMAFFGWLSALLFVIFLIMFIPVLVEYFETGLVPRFPTLIVSIFAALASIISLFIGLCLDVLIAKDRKSYELKVINFK